MNLLYWLCKLKYFLHRSSLAFVFICTAGCAIRPPSSAFDGIYSITTGTRFQPGTGAHTYQGYRDDKVLEFTSGGEICMLDAQAAAIRPNVIGPAGVPIMPGIIPVKGAAFGIDQTEIPNQEWLQYQLEKSQAFFFTQGSAAIQPDSSSAFAPSPGALPVPDYFSNPFYRYYPVVGISWEQALAFCKWRSHAVTANLNKARGITDSLSADYIRCDYRLPTEAEWELAAQAGGTDPYGTACPNRPITVNPRAAAYLKRRAASDVPTGAVEAAIKEYNKSSPVRTVINYQQQGPFFLYLATPGYVFQGPPNAYGIYHMPGNVAELVQETGITKGGSYLDPLEACAVKKRGIYAGPASTIGFRCACQTTFPNRK